MEVNKLRDAITRLAEAKASERAARENIKQLKQSLVESAAVLETAVTAVFNADTRVNTLIRELTETGGLSE